ncbi:MAG: chorismate mutase, partial [Rikenellaceae bacterium]
LDNNIIELIGKRMKLAEKIGGYKRDNNIKVLQISRWEQRLQNRIAKGESFGLNRHFIHKFLDILHQESINIQTKKKN